MNRSHWKLISRIAPRLDAAPDWVRKVLSLSFDEMLKLPKLEEAKRGECALPHFEISRFDSTYLEFLEEQIKLNARGDEYSAILTRRLDDLRPYVDIELLFVLLIRKPESFAIRIEPQAESIVHEEYDDGYK